MFACLLRVAVTESVNRGENLKRRDISTDKDNIIFIPNGKLFNYRSICQGSVLHIRMRINDMCVNTINPMHIVTCKKVKIIYKDILYIRIRSEIQKISL